MGKQEETKIGEKIIGHLKMYKDQGAPIYYEHRSGSGGFNYKKGVPDIWFTVNGMHVECEVKTATGHLSTMQEQFKWRCEKIYHCGYINPHSFEEFITSFNELLCQQGVPLINKKSSQDQ